MEGMSLIVIQTLVDAKLQPSTYPGIYNTTIGLVFFGTPFREIHQDLSSHGKHLELVEQFHKRVYKQNYEVFRVGDDSLLNVVDRFLQTTADDGCRPRIVCFFERMRTNLDVLVDGQTEVSILPSLILGPAYAVFRSYMLCLWTSNLAVLISTDLQ